MDKSGNRIREISLFTAIFLSLFLLILSLSSLLISFNVSISTYIILILASVASLVLSNKVNRSSAFILLLITATIFHLTSFYLLLPVGWSADQRTYFIGSLKDSGRIETLEKFSSEGVYYIRYPIAWLIALITEMISTVGAQVSWLITISTAYLCFIIFLVLVSRILAEKNSLEYIAWITMFIVITIYLHSPFLNLIPSSIGVLSFITVLYLFLSCKKLAPFLLILMIPLLISHGLSIYFTTASLLLVATSYIVTRAQKGEILRAINFAIIVFAGTWLYQVSVQLIDSIVREVPYRLNQASYALLNPFERPLTPSVIEQELRVVYGFDFAISVLAYAFPACLSMIGTLYFLYRFLRVRDNRNSMLMLFSIFCSIIFLIAGLFAWKGLENYVARYLYVYTSPISVLVNTSLLSFALKSKKHLSFKITAFLIFIVVGVACLTENFFTPYASILNTPDQWKFEKLYRNYYGPAMFNRNLAGNIFSADFYEKSLQGKAYLHTSTVSLSSQHFIVYSNGFIYGCIKR